jgi:hypothetical protein
MLMKHGYSDKQEIDHTSTDGSMSPTEEARKSARNAIETEFDE